MFIQKNNIFLDLSKNQKSALISFLKNFVKKYSNLSIDEIADEFMQEEQYYFDVGNPHFEWSISEFENDIFIKDLKYLIKQYLMQLQEKEKQKPFLEKQKAYAKEQRKKAQDFKMSKEKPTQKQLKYYASLCDKYKLDKKDTSNLSRLDLKNLISKIIEDADSKVRKCLENNL